MAEQTRIRSRNDEGTPWACAAEQVTRALITDDARGLATSEARARHARYGANHLPTKKPRHILAIFADQFRGIVVLLLVAAGLLAIVFGDYLEAYAIFAVIITNGLIGLATEWRATRSMEALGRLGVVSTQVVRDGHAGHVPAEQLVPGDLVLLEAGDVVTADIRLVEAAKLQTDESMLTGESLPVGKQTRRLARDTPMMDRSNMLFKGTAVTRGSAKGVVTGIGRNTELGRIFDLVTHAAPQETPLEKRLDALGKRLAWGVMVIAATLAAAGILAGRGTFLAIEVSIALAVAAIPEGLPVVATIALARGIWRMAARNALISRLSAVETLGATRVILTDKTGTLTENRMTVTEVLTGGGRIEAAALVKYVGGVWDDGGERAASTVLLDELLTTAALCANASLHLADNGRTEAVGDPMEIALLLAASRRTISRERLLERFPELGEVPFDPATKLMATLHREDSAVLVAVKGAPESVVPCCTAVRTREGIWPLANEERRAWLDHAADIGARGLRTLAIARKSAADPNEDPYSELTLLGIVGLEDPAREGVKEAIEQCFRAGIAVIMVTGDHAATARQIAADVGLLPEKISEDAFVDGRSLEAFLAQASGPELLRAHVFSRVTPEQKLMLIESYQRLGYVVAMTGDGINDAPALKKADIGVAMGIRGTAVAREAAAMVLLDDNFATIVAAVAHGRAIFENIRKFVVYLLSCNISEVLVVSLATVAGAPLPLLPLQILFLNLVTDVFPALALGVGRGSPAVMDRKPRPSSEQVLTRSHWLLVGLHGAVISLAVLAAMAVAVFYLEFESADAVTVSFCTLALAQLWHVFNMRDDLERVIVNEITGNLWVWIAVATCLVLILLAVYTPLLAGLLELSHPGMKGWLVIALFSLLPLLLAPVVRFAVYRLR